jgi:S-adenosyl-L-methionine hydrolase (adenosine-forming)
VSVVTFLSDFGLEDTFVGVCHGVIAAAAPDVRVIDLTHAVAPGDVRQGAALLSRAVPHTPVAVHLAVVDPGVGGPRRGIAIHASRGDRLVGPDNGLLVPAAEALGGIVAARELTSPAHRREPTSATFHGRDVFAPAAAALARGVAIGDLGDVVEDPVSVPSPTWTAEEGWLTAEVVLIDRFGNVQLAAPGGSLVGLGSDHLDVVVVGASHPARRVRTFAELDVGALGVLVDSDGHAAIVLRDGSAARRVGVSAGDEVEVRARD